MDKTISDFGYDLERGGWYPDARDVQFEARLDSVINTATSSLAKQWVVEHNLIYPDLIFLGSDQLGIDPKDVTGEMVLKACACARLSNVHVFYVNTFVQLVQGGEAIV